MQVIEMRTLEELTKLLKEYGFSYFSDTDNDGILDTVTYADSKGNYEVILTVEYDPDYLESIIGDYIIDYNKVYVVEVMFRGFIMYEDKNGISLDIDHLQYFERAIMAITKPVEYTQFILNIHLRNLDLLINQYMSTLTELDFTQDSSSILDAIAEYNNLTLYFNHPNKQTALCFYTDIITGDFMMKEYSDNEFTKVNTLEDFTEAIRTSLFGKIEYEYLYSNDKSYTVNSLREINKLQVAIEYLNLHKDISKIHINFDEIPMKYINLIREYNVKSGVRYD